MPQGRAELQKKFRDDGVAWEFLKQRGWTYEGFLLKEPEGKTWADIPLDEREAVEYLITEWDWA